MWGDFIMTLGDGITNVFEDLYRTMVQDFTSTSLSETQKCFALICLDTETHNIDLRHQKVLYSDVSTEIQKHIAEYFLFGHKPTLNLSNLINDRLEKYKNSSEYYECESANEFDDFIWACAKKYESLAYYTLFGVICNDWQEISLSRSETQGVIFKMEEMSDYYLDQFFNRKDVRQKLVCIYENFKRIM